jgi:transposase
MRLGFERLGGMVREKMAMDPRSRALFVFVGKRGPTLKVVTWDGTGAVLVHKQLDAGKFTLPRATRAGDQHFTGSGLSSVVVGLDNRSREGRAAPHVASPSHPPTPLGVLDRARRGAPQGPARSMGGLSSFGWQHARLERPLLPRGDRAAVLEVIAPWLRGSAPHTRRRAGCNRSCSSAARGRSGRHTSMCPPSAAVLQRSMERRVACCSGVRARRWRSAR